MKYINLWFSNWHCKKHDPPPEHSGEVFDISLDCSSFLENKRAIVELLVYVGIMVYDKYVFVLTVSIPILALWNWVTSVENRTTALLPMFNKTAGGTLHGGMEPQTYVTTPGYHSVTDEQTEMNDNQLLIILQWPFVLLHFVTPMLYVVCILCILYIIFTVYL